MTYLKYNNRTCFDKIYELVVKSKGKLVKNSNKLLANKHPKGMSDASRNVKISWGCFSNRYTVLKSCQYN